MRSVTEEAQISRHKDLIYRIRRFMEREGYIYMPKELSNGLVNIKNTDKQLEKRLGLLVFGIG